MAYFACGWPKTYVLPLHHANTTSPSPSPAIAATTANTSTNADSAPTPPPSPSPHPVHAIHLDPSSRYFLTVSSRALHIWNARQHRVLLARFVVAASVTAVEGPLVDAVWSPNSRAIIASFANGLVLLFSLYQHPDRSLLHFHSMSSPSHDDAGDDPMVHPSSLFPLRLTRETELRITHGAHRRVTCLTPCPAGALLATSSAALTCISWDFEILWRAHVPELLRHHDALAKMGVMPNDPELTPDDSAILRTILRGTSAKNESNKNDIANSDHYDDDDDDHLGGVVALAYNRDVQFCGVVLGAGPAVLLAMHAAGHGRPSAIDGRWLRCSNAVSIALEPRRMLATVGLANGDVEQYYIGVPAGDQCPLMRTISLANWYFNPADIGRPSVLRWTDDGAALVVGWERTGLAVWSVSGCRLMWTLPQVGGQLPMTPASRQQQQHRSSSGTAVSPLENGVRAACWGPQGFFLWAAPRMAAVPTQHHQRCHFMEFAFLKNGTAGTICQSDSSRLAMLGSDRVLLLRHAEQDAGLLHQQQLHQQHHLDDQRDHDAMSAPADDPFAWQHLLIPHDYLWRNWPPTHLAVSADASHIAVAANFGVAICHVRSQRWRVFADLEHGRRIKCTALAWVGKTIIIGNEIGGSTGSRASAHPRTSASTSSSLSLSLSLSASSSARASASGYYQNYDYDFDFDHDSAPASSGQKRTKKSHELLFYLRDQGDSTTLQMQRSLPSRPVLTDVRADGFLLVMCEDARVFLFKITEHPTRARVDVAQVYTLLLPTRESGLMYQQDNGIHNVDVQDSSVLSSLSSSATASSPASVAMAAAAAAIAATSTSNSSSRSAASGGASGNNIAPGGLPGSVMFDHALPPPPAPGGGITQAKIFPPLSHAVSSTSHQQNSSGTTATFTASNIPTHIMLLRSTGSLILLDTEKMVSTALLRYVERFWYTPPHCTPFNMMTHQPVWWAYGDDGLHVCFKDVTSSSDSSNKIDDDMDVELMSPRTSAYNNIKKNNKLDVEQWFELDAEVYPLAIMSKYGMLLGATQRLVVNSVKLDDDVSPMPRHSVQVKRQPILHTLLRHILMKPASDERLALQVALKCASQPQFVDSLEWLLYEAVLEHDEDYSLNASDNHHTYNNSVPTSNGVSAGHDPTATCTSPTLSKRMLSRSSLHGFPESPRRQKAGSALFPRVVRLLKYFGEYEDVVVRCARKLDSKRWPLLFSLAGEPAALLEQCFVSGRLRTAACLLVILQDMWGFISSTPHSLRLVEAALARGEVDLASDLSNFLLKADRAGMLNSSQLRSIEDVSWIAEAAMVPPGSAISHVLSSPSLDNLNTYEDVTVAAASAAKYYDNTGNLNHHQHNSHHQHSDRIPAVDAAVLNHARWLLSRMDLRALVGVAVKMDFPLHEWLKRELKGKNASRPFVRDFGSTILALHRQFQCPQPDLVDVRRAMKVFNIQLMHASNITVNTTTHTNGSPAADEGGSGDVVQNRGSKQQLQREQVQKASSSSVRQHLPSHAQLMYLMTVARVARAPDLTLCCATLLLDIVVLRMVLRGHEELFGPYIAALNEFNVSGYDALSAVMNEVAVPK